MDISNILTDLELMIHESFYDGEINDYEYEHLLEEYTIKETAMVVKYSSDIYTEKSTRNDNMDTIKDLDKFIMEPVNGVVSTYLAKAAYDAASGKSRGGKIDVKEEEKAYSVYVMAINKSADRCKKYLKWVGDWKSPAYTVASNTINSDTTPQYNKIVSKYKKKIEKYNDDLNKIRDEIKKVGFNQKYNDPSFPLETLARNIKTLMMTIQRELNKVSMKAINDSKKKEKRLKRKG